MEAIEMEGLTKIYRKRAALDNVRLTVEQGERFGFIGPNGAGKSTTIKLLLDFIKPSKGSARIFGLDAQKDSESLKRIIGYVPSDVHYYSNLTVEEILMMTGKFHHIQNIKEMMAYYVERFALEPKKKMKDLSLGNRKKVAIVNSLIFNPELLILDEPTNGLDPLMQHRLFEELNYHNKEGATIFISTHNLPEVEAFCTRTAFIREGKIISVEDMASGYQPGKVVTLTGSAIGTEDFESKGYRVLSRTDRVVSLLYKDNVKQILADMAPLDLEDIEIRNQNLEEKFMTLYGGGESHE
ncbi:ABC transporter ATP-binding protein [Trichococcus alkaliphilus]|uniref:ABC transporter ATP-binding protein n=1 Tax=Trichococcus alkaliphilus TaxID=2052943 RepID=UPI000D0ABA54|nr:ABC transporter ATP-binding protein [Trichococcus alkaliphilus]